MGKTPELIRNSVIRKRAQSLHQLLLLFQYRNRLLMQAFDQPVSPLESHILIEASSSKPIIARDLVKLHIGTQALISRRVQGLLDNGLLKSAAAKDDKRQFQLLLTAKGRKLIEKVDTASNLLKKEFGKSLQVSEEKKLAAYLNQLCERAGVPAGVSRQQDAHLRSAFRRMARFMGVIKPDFMGSPLSSVEWQLLQAVKYAERAPAANDLIQSFSLEQSAVSRAITRFKKMRMITERPDASDKRVKRLFLEKEGVLTLERIDNEATDKIGTQLVHFDERDSRSFINLLRRYVMGASGKNKRPYNLSVPDSEEQLGELRRWFVNELLRDDSAEIPHSILAPESLVVAMSTAGDSAGWLGFIEFVKDGKKVRIDNCHLPLHGGGNYLDVALFVSDSLDCASTQLGVSEVVSKKELPTVFELLQHFSITPVHLELT